jgi:hypothetical protein
MSASFQLTPQATEDYIIVYRPQSKPLQVIAILHGNQDLKEILKDRLPLNP